jgi:uncharacterized protein YcbK (DUF882 family)
LRNGFRNSATGCLGIFFAGLLLSIGLGTNYCFAAADGERRIALYNIHTKETLDIVYMRNGKRLPEAMKKINWIARDWRQNEATTMDPKLIDLLWDIRRELGTREPTHIISGYRSSKTNKMLRKTRGGQAKKSRHILGKAMDIHFPDVSVKRLRYSALIRERGGVGYYPTSAIPFVHIDTGRTRHWPRMPRYELALLFPNGKSKHVPSDGRRINRSDVRKARAKYTELAVQIASFHDLRKAPRAPRPTLLASGWGARVRPSLPRDRAPAPASAKPPQAEFKVASLGRLVPPAPRPVTRTAPQGRGPTSSDKRQLASLFALAALGGAWSSKPEPAKEPVAGAAPARPTASRSKMAARQSRLTSMATRLGLSDRQPRLPKPFAEDDAAGWSTGFVAAPAFDEEHPEELHYRPFALAPLLTASASADDPVLARMEHPDVAKTLDLLDEQDVTLPMRFTATQQVAELMWTQQFTGRAINPTALSGARSNDDSGLARRSVQTSMR